MITLIFLLLIAVAAVLFITYIFQINVFFKIKDIFLLDKKVSLGNIPEVGISTSSKKDIGLLEDIDKDFMATYHEMPLESYVDEHSFFMKMENIKY